MVETERVPNKWTKRNLQDWVGAGKRIFTVLWHYFNSIIIKVSNDYNPKQDYELW